MNIKQLNEAIHKLLEDDGQIANIQTFLKDKAKPDMEGTAWLQLPSTENYKYIVLLNWQDGYDEEDNPFIKDGYGLNAEIRIDNGTMFKEDTPAPICTSEGDVLSGITLTQNDIEDNFASTAIALYDLYNEAIECEEYSKKYIEV